LKAGDASRDEIIALDRKVDAQMAEARKFAVDSPLPPPETALQHVFA
jgi:TPP-dependent pyruvate/acetoin dehydrogenase alpha subunit